MAITPHHTEMSLKVNAVMGDGRWRDYEKTRRMLMPLIPPGIAIRRNEHERMSAGRSKGVKAPIERFKPRSIERQIESGQRRIVADFLNNPNFERDKVGTAGRVSRSGDAKIRLVRPFRVGGKYAEPMRIARDRAQARAEMLEQQQKLLKDYLREIGHGAAAERLAPHD